MGDERPFKQDRHEAKIAATSQMLALVEGIQRGVVNTDEWFSESHEYAAGDDFYSRMAGLYVDVDARLDKVVGGGIEITAQRAHETVMRAVHALRVALNLLWVANGGPVEDGQSLRPSSAWHRSLGAPSPRLAGQEGASPGVRPAMIPMWPAHLDGARPTGRRREEHGALLMSWSPRPGVRKSMAIHRQQTPMATERPTSGA